MRLKEGTFHVSDGPLKHRKRKWFTYKAGDEVNPEHVEKLKQQGAVLETELVPEAGKKKDFTQELRKVRGVGPKTAEKIAKDFQDSNKLIQALKKENTKLREVLSNKIVDALEKVFK